MRSQAEINEQIEWLKANRDKVMTHGFGANNREKMDAEITVLEEGLSADDVWDRTNEEGEDDEEKDWSWEIGESARQAVDWRDGNENTSPKENWAPLIKGA